MHMSPCWSQTAEFTVGIGACWNNLPPHWRLTLANQGLKCFCKNSLLFTDKYLEWGYKQHLSLLNVWPFDNQKFLGKQPQELSFIAASASSSAPANRLRQKRRQTSADNICCASLLLMPLYTFLFQRVHKFHLPPRYSIQIIMCHKVLTAQIAWPKSVLCNASVWITTSQMTVTAVGTKPAQLAVRASGASIISYYMSSLK